MTNISKQEVEYIAKLARIFLTEPEKEQFQKEISAILEFVSELNKVDTKNVSPLSSVVGLENIAREDKITNCSNQGELLKNAPLTQNGHIKTGRVL